MSALLGLVRRKVFGIPAKEISFARRGFRGGGGGMRERIEHIGKTFSLGYHTALEIESADELSAALNRVPNESCGFAFEGAAMALALLDFLTPWRRNRFNRFLEGTGEPHAYMLHVGMGWAMARLPVNARKARLKLNPLLGWLCLDGYGFHEGFFRWPRYVNGQTPPGFLKNYEKRVFDQGLGRSLWFIDGGDVERIPKTIRDFQAERRADLWSGVGLACVYAGIVPPDALRMLRESSGSHCSALAQGAAFAAKARQRAGNVSEYTRTVCETLCDCPAEEAAELTDAALDKLSEKPDVPAYELWRQRVQHHFTEAKVT